MKNFALWLLRKIGNNIISFPRAHFIWYKHGLRYETGLFVLYTLGRFAVTGILLTLIGIGINIVFSVHSDVVILASIVFMYVYYVIEFITVILSIQYDKYCNELNRTMDALKKKEADYDPEDDIMKRVQNLQSYAQAQQAFNHAANMNTNQGYAATQANSYQNYGVNQK